MKALSTIFISLFNSIWLILLIPAFSAPAGSSFLGFSQSTVQAQTTGQGQSSLNAQDLSNVRADDITDAQLRAFINRAEEEGLSEADAFALARERGLPASEEQKLRRRIAELEGERAQDTSSQIGQLEPVRTTPDTSTTQSESDAEIESEAVQRTVRSLDDEQDDQRIYGHSLFTDQTLDVFRTTEGAKAPDTYVLGDGDQIRINIFGTSQADLLLEINDEGYVQPSQMPKIFLKGLTMREARSVLRERLSNFYTFQSDQFAMSLNTARTITINVFGESNVSGSFTISALNSAFNALAASGGPTQIGSVRDIRLIRGKERRTMDVYQFMNDPGIQFDFDLRNNDIIYIPVAEKVVTLRGAVVRPMRYELKAGEDLLDLIRFAGGIDSERASDLLQIQRIVDYEPVLKEWKLMDILSGQEEVEMQHGDVVRIRPIGRSLEQFVEVEGSVFYPGRFSLTQSPTLNKLLEEAQLRPQAKTDLIFVERRLLDESVSIIPVEWNALQENGEDFELERRDRIRVFDQERFRDVATLRVAGHVRTPIERSLQFDERITIRNALELTGGLRPTAAETAFIFRRNLFNTDIVEHIRVDLTRDTDFELQPGDQLNVYDRSVYSDIGSLSIGGMVNKPVNTQFDSDLTLSELLKMAEGFRRGVALDRIDVFRLDVSFSQGTSYDVISLAADSLFNITASPDGFRLQPFDRIVVRRIPQFELGRSVQIEGEVKYPGLYPLETRRVHLSDLIREAGGLTDVADDVNATLLRSFNNMGPVSINLKDALMRSGDQRFDPVIFDDDIVTIPKFINTVTIRITGTRVGELQDAGVVQSVQELTGLPDDGPGLTRNLNVIYEGNRSAKWYIENFAGGFAGEADKRSVTVTTPSGKVMGTSRQLFFFRNYPDVKPGSTIALRLEPPELPEESEPFDWDRAFNRTMQATTTLVTLLILLERLN